MWYDQFWAYKLMPIGNRSNRSNRAGVRWLFHRLRTCREESPAQRKVGGIAAKTSFEQLFVQYKCTVMDEINGHYLQLASSHKSLYRDFLSTRPTRLGEPPPVSLLLWSRGGLVIVRPHSSLRAASRRARAENTTSGGQHPYPSSFRCLP